MRSRDSAPDECDWSSWRLRMAFARRVMATILSISCKGLTIGDVTPTGAVVFQVRRCEWGRWAAASGCLAVSAIAQDEPCAL